MDTLQARIVQLEQENAALRALLKKHGIAYPPEPTRLLSISLAVFQWKQKDVGHVP